MPSVHSSNPAIADPVPEAGSRTETRPAQAVLTAWIDSFSKVHVCVLPLQDWKTAQAQKSEIMLDGSVSPKKIKEALRELGWRGQRENPCYVVIPSEDVLLFIQEFPTIDSNEARLMAESFMQGMIELDQEQHVLLIQELHRSQAGMVCALAIFGRDRLQRIFEGIQRFGVTNPRFVLDIIGLWQISGEVRENGFWGRIFKSESSPLVVVKALKIVNGVVRGVTQKFYSRQELDPEWIQTLGPELFPEDFNESSNPGITWHLSQGSSEGPSRLVDLCRLAADRHLINFEPQPGFWREHLLRQRKRGMMVAAGIGAAACYAVFVLFLAGLSAWQWYEGRQQKQILQEQEIPYREAMALNRELELIKASQDPSGNALEVLRQITEAMPETFTLENFTYRFHSEVKLRGTSTQSDANAVYDFVGRLRRNTSFKNVQTDSTNDRPGGGLSWQITIPLHSLPTS